MNLTRYTTQPAGLRQALSGFHTSKHNTAGKQHIAPLNEVIAHAFCEVTNNPRIYLLHERFYFAERFREKLFISPSCIQRHSN